MLLARYFMFNQVYLHATRRIYDTHLMEFLEKWLKGGKFSIDLEEHLSLTDNEVFAEIEKASRDTSHPARLEAMRITKRKHFKVLWSRNPSDKAKNPDAIDCIFQSAITKYGAENVRKDSYSKNKGADSFPVELDNGLIADAISVSDTLSKVPFDNVEYIFADREIINNVRNWLNENRESIIHETGCECKEGSNGKK